MEKESEKQKERGLSYTFIISALLEKLESSCLQEQSAGFSLRGALFDVLVDNKEDFIYLFTKKVNLNGFLDELRLNDLYNQVLIILYMCYAYNIYSRSIFMSYLCYFTVLCFTGC